MRRVAQGDRIRDVGLGGGEGEIMRSFRRTYTAREGQKGAERTVVVM